jgi:TRAP transporter TAXI family solute receptor
MSGGGRRKTCAGAIGGVLLAVAAARGAAPSPPEPIFLSIGGGVVDSAAFRWSSALAQILSRPPGLPKCDAGAPCGVPGVVASAQTFDQPQALLKALAEGSVTTGILPAQRLYEARCTPPKGDAPAPIRALKTIYRQPVQFVISMTSAPKTPKDLAGKAIAVGERGSDSDAVATALLEAYGLSKKVKLVRQPPAQAITSLRGGAVQAAIFVGHAADTQLDQLVGQGGFTLLSLADSPERRRLLQALPVFEAAAIPPGAYLNLPAISTLAEPVLWVSGSAIDPSLTEKLVVAISEPHNAARLAELVEPVAPVPEGEAFLRLPVPPAQGAERFAAEAHLPISVVDCSTTAASR